MKTLLTLLTFMLNASVLYAQLNIGQQNNNPVTPTWDQYEFMKYGKIGATLYTGTISYSIPIFTYKDKDFDIPISVNYSTNGYRVNHKSGLLGHGWSLSAGGMITREVKGIPDEELFSVSSASGYGVSGTLYHGYLSLPCNSREIKVLPVVGGGNYLNTNPLDKATGKQYVGSTYNTKGICGRWADYADTGHGGDKDLKPLIEKDAAYARKNFQWCILETLPLKILEEHAIDRESLYKRKFGTREFGYNNN